MENQDVSSTPQTDKEESPKKVRGSGIQKVILYLAIGILIGVLVAEKAIYLIPSILPTLMVIFMAFFLLIILLIVSLPHIFNFLVRRYTGKDLNVEGVLGDLQAKANHIADSIAAAALSKADPEIQKNIRKDIPDILHYVVFSRLRSTGTRLLINVFIAIGGLMGTILLYNQNQLLGTQNQLLLNQNEKIDNQILLDEASRRSSLNFLMANVLDKIDEELKEAERQNKPRQLSPQLIGRISSLSQSFQPYRFLENGVMTTEPKSPERGNLLLAIINSNLDTFTLSFLFRRTNFRFANLSGANIGESYLWYIDLKGANLLGTNLIKTKLCSAKLNGADLRAAHLTLADLRAADLRLADLKTAYLIGADLKAADLSRADLRAADLHGVDFRKAKLLGANFGGAKLREANLSGVYLLEVNFREANLELANLREAYLEQTNFSKANLKSTDLSETDLSWSDMSGANLQYANLRDAYLGQANLSEANFKWVKNLTLEQLEKTKTLYQIQGLDPKLETALKKERPCLFTKDGCN